MREIDYTADLTSAARRIASAYPLTEQEAAAYLTITGRVDLATEAGRAHSLGFHHPDIKDALLYGEATTAEGIAHWIRSQRRA